MRRIRLFLCLVCLVVANLLATTAQQPAVLDTNGQPVEPGILYYIIPSGGGGATLVDRNNGSCPLYVGQETNVDQTGLPVLFLPFVSDETTIFESNDFSLSFWVTTALSCDQMTDWALDNEADPRSDERVLIATRRENAPSNLFRIQRDDGNAYKINYCPNDCPTCRYRCGDVGVSVENGRRLLALYVPALQVVFRKA